ncbi:MAG: tRNA (guanosine(46)-N7)-methyltransferase TrmB [Bacillota bacterium]|nr:tRNA (guanosine(46)-N7)-methyltransferase TrmB [Bacillota bacterium]
MRMRRKPWARPELAECPFFIDTPIENRGKWADAFQNKTDLHVELGCGKGSFVSATALKNPNINYLAIDIKSEVLAVGRRTIVKQFEASKREIINILLTAFDIERVDEILSKEDNIKRFYINFCNPWPKGKHQKRRLTFPRQLNKYREFLADGGEIRFKTDDLPLFIDSLDYFAECGFDVIYKTNDLHKSDVSDNIMTEHEIMFSNEGIPINYCIAVKR